MVPVVMPTNDAQVPASRIIDSREELRQKITLFNNNTQGYIMSLVSHFLCPRRTADAGGILYLGYTRERERVRAFVCDYVLKVC